MLKVKADIKLRTIAGRFIRELKHNLGDNHDYDSLLEILEASLSQEQNNRKKIYSIHKPQEYEYKALLGTLSFCPSRSGRPKPNALFKSFVRYIKELRAGNHIPHYKAM